jgi:protocatechuate 3,4-dioxygenase beta subunit
MEMEHEEHDDFGGLQRDLLATGAINRRGLFRLASRLGAAAAAVPLIHCGGSSPTSPTTTNTDTSAGTTGTTGTGGTACSTVPQETAGPYPGDGSNGPDVLSLSGVVRSDIRSSFAGLQGTADGVPLTIALTIVSASTCAPLSGRAVYVWHCDRLGRYSLYTSGATDQNYLRGVQAADGSGRVSFTSIFPACYSGRWPHIHFEVYPSLSAATDALPKETCDQVYATSGYEESVTNLSRVSLATDMVFSDGATLELGTISGSIGSGLTATLTVAV